MCILPQLPVLNKTTSFFYLYWFSPVLSMTTSFFYLYWFSPVLSMTTSFFYLYWFSPHLSGSAGAIEGSSAPKFIDWHWGLPPSFSHQCSRLTLGLAKGITMMHTLVAGRVFVDPNAMISAAVGNLYLKCAKHHIILHSMLRCSDEFRQ